MFGKFGNKCSPSNQDRFGSGDVLAKMESFLKQRLLCGKNHLIPEIGVAAPAHALGRRRLFRFAVPRTWFHRL